jgi:precorrin-3B synthase
MVPYLTCSVLPMPELALDAAGPAGPAGPAVRGACPSGHRPFLAADGLLVRIRVPGGELASGQAAALARVAGRDGNGVVELTSRANVQVRGVRGEALHNLQADLAAAGLMPADAADDERRNVMAAPAAGLDPTEMADVRPITRGLLARLVRLPAGLHPKAGALLDGGGAVSVRGLLQDVALGAARRTDTGELVAELALGAPLPLAAEPASPAAVVPVSAAAEVAAHALAIAGPARRVHELVDEQGVEAVAAEIGARAGVAVVWVDARLLVRATPQTRPPIGVHRTWQDGVVFVGTAPVLGRLDAAELSELALAAGRHGDGTVRLTPWRSVLVPGVPADRAEALVAELAGLGLVTDPTDPALSVVACVGSAGCSAGLADTLADARSLIDDLRRTGGNDRNDRNVRNDGNRPTPSVHVSGCAKRCASRRDHDITLVAIGPGRYAS